MQGSELALKIASIGASARTLPGFRGAVLGALGKQIRFDVGIFHAFSPRVPLETGAMVGIDAAKVAATLPAWDTLAVELGALREYANEHGVATDRDVFPRDSPARRRFLDRALHPFGMSRMAMTHLAVRDEVRSGIALFSRRPEAFSRAEMELLSVIRPVVALADALLVRDTASPRASVPVRLACRDDRLTPRQREIVEHVALGHTNEQIASALRLSATTVRNHLAVIFARLGASNRADAVRLAVLVPAT